MGSRLLSSTGYVLLLWAGVECWLNESTSREIWNDPSYGAFMFSGDLLLLLWMWGVSMHVWRTVGINFIALLSLEETTLVSMERPEDAVYASAKELSIIYLLVFIVFNVTQRFTTPEIEEERKSFHFAHILPLLMIAYFGCRLVTPWAIRKCWWFFLLKVICAPFYSVNFQAGYIGDLLHKSRSRVN